MLFCFFIIKKNVFYNKILVLVFYYKNSSRSSTQVVIRGVPAKDVVRKIGARVQIPSTPPKNN